MLGWRILREGRYRLDMPALSPDEEELILGAQECFKDEARGAGLSREDGKDAVRRSLARAAEARGLWLERSQQECLGEIASMHIQGFAFMDRLLDDPEIEEISVIGPKKQVHVYLRKKGWMGVNACFDDERAICDMVNRMSRSIGRRITLQNPRLDAMLPDGSRLHASLPPVSAGEITIRRFRESPLSPREICANGTLSPDAMALLSVLMQSDVSLIIAGNTASGKTTTLNALFSFVPHNERVLITEETPEISIPHEHQVRLVANREMGISLKDLVYDSLRMRPDRMVVGEVRNREEAEALFDVLLAGQARGSYATFHAQSADEALSRLRSFGIRQDDLKSIDCIIVQRRMLGYDPDARTGSETRRVVEIMEVDGGMQAYRDGGKADAGPLLERVAGSFGLSKREMDAELRMRRELIMKSGPGHAEFFRQVQGKLFGSAG